MVAIAGRPNVGKSTFMNRVLGTKIAIVTPKPQTTRDRILGILSRPDVQIMFHDTPGIHEPHKALNRRMLTEVEAALVDADVILMMTDAVKAAQGLRQDADVLDRVRCAGRPTILALNKIDLISKPDLLPLLEAYGQALPFIAMVPISATQGDGVDHLVDEVVRLLPEGPSMYPDDELSDRSLRFMAAEIVREKVMLATRKEIPYSTAVTIDEFIEPEPPAAVRISATIHVERTSQKAIVIGRGGSLLKQIGIDARVELELLVDRKVMLTLFVRVDEDWAGSEEGLRRVLDQ